MIEQLKILKQRAKVFEKKTLKQLAEIIEEKKEKDTQSLDTLLITVVSIGGNWPLETSAGAK